MKIYALLCAILMIVPCIAQAQAVDYKVIVNESNAVSSMNAVQLSKLFLKKSVQWENGTRVLPVDQVEQSTVRQSFTKRIHLKEVAAIKSFWQQQIFSGRDVPPPEKTSDAEVVSYVKANPGAIGYVSAEAATAGVKVVRVVE